MVAGMTGILSQINLPNSFFRFIQDKESDMIQFVCGKCGRSFSVNDKYSGRKVRCPKCQAAGQVPMFKVDDVLDLTDESVQADDTSRSQNSSDVLRMGQIQSKQPATQQSNQAAKGSAKGDASKTISILGQPIPRIMILMGVVVVALLVGITSWVLLRDTWEQDHLKQLQSLANEAGLYQDNKDYPKALETTNMLLQIIGTRIPKDAQLVMIHNNAISAKSFLDDRVTEQKNKVILQQNETQLLSLLAKADSLVKINIYGESLLCYQSSLQIIHSSSTIGISLASYKQRVEDGIRLTTSEIRNILIRREDLQQNIPIDSDIEVKAQLIEANKSVLVAIQGLDDQNYTSIIDSIISDMSVKEDVRYILKSLSRNGVEYYRGLLKGAMEHFERELAKTRNKRSIRNM